MTKGKMITTALDGLPYGTISSESITKKMPVQQMPQGISRKMLLRDVVCIAWPTLVELILTQLTSMADQIMVGRMQGEAGVIALSAVGLSVQPKFLLMTMIQALNMGATAVVARFRGQQNREKANQVFRQALVLNLILSILFSVLGLCVSGELIRLLCGTGVGEEVLDQAKVYLDIQLYGFVPLVLSITMTATLRGIGDSQTPMIYNTVANVVNLFFNYVLIYGKLGCPALGVAGASIATVIGQTVAFIIALIVILSKKRYIYWDFKEKFGFDKELMRDVISIGMPSMIEQLLMRVGMMVFTRSVTSLGPIMYATHYVCMNIQIMSLMLGQAFAGSATTLVGQSLGKRRYDMAVLYVKQTNWLGLCASVVLGVLMALFGRPLVSLYNSTPEVIEVGSQILLVVAFSQPLQSLQFIVTGAMRGAGDTRYAAVVTAATVLGVRSVLAVLLINVMKIGIWGAWVAILADQITRTVFMTARFKTNLWARIALRHAEARSAT